MTTKIKKFVLAVLTVSGMSIGSLAAMTTSVAAHVVCDDDGDDCYRTHPYYYDRDWDREWHERREWEERRERDAYRRWYWSRRPYPYGWYQPGPATTMWFNF